jgi:WD40 repeat protein
MAPFTGHSGVIKTVAVGHAGGTPVVVSGDDYGTVLLWALNRRRHRPIRLDAPAGVNAIPVGWPAALILACMMPRKPIR